LNPAAGRAVCSHGPHVVTGETVLQELIEVMEAWAAEEFKDCPEQFQDSRE